MKYLILFSFILVGCSTEQRPPSKFVPGKREVIVEGCERLHKEVEEHNKKFPNDKKVADC